MLNLIQIRNFLRLGSYARLIDRILRNGRCPHSAARSILCEPAAARPAALALALQRWCELTWDADETAALIAAELLMEQREDGLFGSIAATAVAVRGLMEWVDRCESLNRDVSARMREAVNRTLLEIGRRQDEDGLLAGDPVASAIVLWQLDTLPAARPALDMAALARAVEAASATDSDLCHFAYAVAA